MPWPTTLHTTTLQPSITPNNNTTTTTANNTTNTITLSIITWNILAESYLTPRSHPNLPTISIPMVFSPLHRRQLLLSTLTKLTTQQQNDNNNNYDVLCLQEVDLYEDVIHPHMSSLGYDGVRAMRRQGRVDCCCIFYKRTVWRVRHDETVRFDDLGMETTTPTTTPTTNHDDDDDDDDDGSGDDTAETADEDATMTYNGGTRKKRGQYRNSRPPSSLTGVVQSFLRRNAACIAVLEHVESGVSVAVASAHFYWNPGYEYVKLAQSKYLLDKLRRMAERFTEMGEERIPCVVCGDSNSLPGSVVHRFLMDGVVDARRVAPWYFPNDDDNDNNKVASNNSNQNTATNDVVDYNDVSLMENGLTSLELNNTIPSPPPPHPYQTVPPNPHTAYPVRYLLDYSLNRFTRWLRMLGIDAALETAAEEKERTSNNSTSTTIIALFRRCHTERRTLLTTSYKLLLRKDCPPGSYLISPTAQRKEVQLCHLLLTHGVTLRPTLFLTRCVVCNGHISQLLSNEAKRRAFEKSKAPVLMELAVYACDGCGQSYWWSELPNSSASRVKLQVEHLLRMALRMGVGVQGGMSLFDYVDVEEEVRIGRVERMGVNKRARLEALEWMKCRALRHDFEWGSGYGEDDVSFTNVTDDFVGVLDYILYERKRWNLVGRLHVPTTFEEMMVVDDDDNDDDDGGRQQQKTAKGYLIPNHLWPSDHLALGCIFTLVMTNGKRNDGDDDKDVTMKKTMTTTIPTPIRNQQLTTTTTTKPDKIMTKTTMTPQRQQQQQEQSNITTAAAAAATVVKKPHRNECRCGCIPKNIFSLFEMAEMRKKYLADKKKFEA